MNLEKLYAKFPGGILRTEHPFYMADAIRDIPDCLDACLSESILDKIRLQVGTFKPNKIYAIGCGTSYNACQAVCYSLRSLLEIPAAAYDAHDFLLDFPPGVDQTSMVISISESGNSITTCLSQEKAEINGAFTVGISANPKSRLATNAKLNITDPFLHEIPLGKTRTFESTALLGMLSGVMTQDSNQQMKFIGQMKEVNQLIRENLNYWEGKAKTIALGLSGVTTRYITAGFGAQKAVADEIGLKLIEVVCESATSFGLEEFTHGPSATFRKDLGIVLFQTDGRTLEKAVQIAHGISISDARLVIITDKPEAGWPAKALKINLPEIPNPQIFGQFPAAAAAQYLFYYLAIHKGKNPDVNSEDTNPELGEIYAYFFPPGTH
jgi:glutamine---fructose-6-phosphate transaminase (isomerizing)